MLVIYDLYILYIIGREIGIYKVHESFRLRISHIPGIYTGIVGQQQV